MPFQTLHFSPVGIDIPRLQREVALRRSQRSYRQLFLHYYKPLVRFATSITRSREAAEEIYSSVFLKLWNLNGALGNIDNLTVYLYISIKNSALNYIARYHKMKTVSIDMVELDLLQEHQTPERDLLQSELKQNIQQAIRSLPAKCQLVYKLIKEDDFSYKEVAKILNISVNTVEGHMTTALSKLSVGSQWFRYP